jgi:hypothetical protein
VWHPALLSPVCIVVTFAYFAHKHYAFYHMYWSAPYYFGYYRSRLMPDVGGQMEQETGLCEMSHDAGVCVHNG